MKYSVEDVKRLLSDIICEPEDIVEHGPSGIFISTRYVTGWSSDYPLNLLLTTRRQLEIAREALKAVIKIDEDTNQEWANGTTESSEYWMDRWADELLNCGKIAGDAIDAINKEGES